MKGFGFRKMDSCVVETNHWGEEKRMDKVESLALSYTHTHTQPQHQQKQNTKHSKGIKTQTEQKTEHKTRLHKVKHTQKTKSS